MAKSKIDGVVEAVHYDSNGNVKWVRVYIRRGSTYTDRIKLDRQMLIDQLKAGKKYYAGKRVPLKASTFEVTKQVQLVPNGGREVLSTSDETTGRDTLINVPII